MVRNMADPWKILTIVMLCFVIIMYVPSQYTLHLLGSTAETNSMKNATLPGSVASNHHDQDFKYDQDQRIDDKLKEMDFGHEFEARRNGVREGCKRFFPGISAGINDGEVFVRNLSLRLLVNERLKLLWCRVDKVAGTHWFFYLNKLGIPKFPPETPVLDDVSEEIFWRQRVGATEWKLLRDYDPRQAAVVIQNYTKVMWVRDPIVRLLSSYRAKLVTNERRRYFERLQIIETCRPNASKEEIEKAESVTLEEFFTFLALNGQFKEKFNLHWRPYYRICDVCKIPFDFIGKMEHMDDESDFILSQIQRDGNFPRFPPAYRNKTTASLARDLVSQLPKQLVQSVVDLYEEDYQLFGYAKLTV